MDSLKDTAAFIYWLARLVLPVLPGMIALYLLLPRPKPYPRILGVAFGIVQLAVGGVLLARTAVGAHWVEACLFYTFAALALIGGALLVTQPNPARGAVSFTLVILSTCGLFLLQGAPFLTVGTVIIYAGAIIVTFLFVIMLSQQHGPSDADARSREPLLVCLAGGLLLGVLLGALRRHYDVAGVDLVLSNIDVAVAAENREPDFQDVAESLNRLPGGTPLKAMLVEQLENAFERSKAGPPEAVRKELTALRAVVAAARDKVGDIPPPAGVTLSPFAGKPTNRPGDARLPAGNVAALGRTLFTDYLLAVEIGGTLLLVATIGAIAITHRIGRRGIA